MVVLTPVEREKLSKFFFNFFFKHISQMPNVSTFGNTADIYALELMVNRLTPNDPYMGLPHR